MRSAGAKGLHHDNMRSATTISYVVLYIASPPCRVPEAVSRVVHTDREADQADRALQSACDRLARCRSDEFLRPL